MATKSIVEIILTNYKKHHQLAAKVNGNSFILQGRNEAGKSSVLQAIDDLIQTNQHLPPEVQEKNPDVVISDDAENGQAEIVLQTNNGDLVRVTRKFTKAGLGRYELRVKEGERWQPKMSPKQVFVEMFGNCLDLSPLVDMSGAEQIRLIQGVLGRDKDVQQAIADAEATMKKLREERLLCGRDVKDLRAKFNVPEYRALVNYENEEPVDIAAIEAKKIDPTDSMKDLNRASLANEMADQYISTIATFKIKDPQIVDHLDKAVELLKSKKTDLSAINNHISEINKLNAIVALDLTAAQLRNEMIEKAKSLTADRALLAQKEAEYDAYTEKIQTILDGIADYTASVPVGDYYPGLELVYELDTEGKVLREGLFLRGLPFNKRQQSYGEMVYALICVSKALNPNGFNFVKIGHWNELDPDNQQKVLDLAKREEIQLGIEKVSDNREIEIKVIES